MRRLFAAALVTVLASACAPDPTPVTMATYNLGLAPGFVPFTTERTPEVLAATADLDVDLLCVQEVWHEAGWDTLKSASAERWPHVVRRDADPGEVSDEPECDTAEVDPLRSCVDLHCQVSVDELAGCVLTHCGEQWEGVAPGCQECVVANLGNDVETIFGLCAISGGGAYAYGGSYGTAILTGLDVIESGSVDWPATFNRRGALYALVEAEDGARYATFCTHTTPDFATVPWPAEEGSWAQEQASQLAALQAWADEKAPEGTAVLLGDFNCGPAVGDGIDGEVPDNYALIQGYTDAVMISAPQCTFCAENPLVGGPDHEGTSVLIDHIFVRGFEGSITAERILDAEITVLVGEDEVTTAYSDHYGVAATLSP